MPVIMSSWDIYSGIEVFSAVRHNRILLTIALLTDGECDNRSICIDNGNRGSNCKTHIGEANRNSNYLRLRYASLYFLLEAPNSFEGTLCCKNPDLNSKQSAYS